MRKWSFCFLCDSNLWETLHSTGQSPKTYGDCWKMLSKEDLTFFVGTLGHLTRPNFTHFDIFSLGQHDDGDDNDDDGDDDDFNDDDGEKCFKQARGG